MIWLYYIVPVILFIVYLSIQQFSKDRELNKQKIVIGCACLTFGIVLQTALYFGMIYAGQHDYEVLNGQVTGKERDKVSCEHSYECMCYYTESCSGTGSNRSCTRTKHCSTCYEHNYDVDWDVHTTLGTINIDRVDRQGLREPARWTQVQIGEPVAMNHGYTNYVLGNKDSLFSKDKKYSEQFKGQLPEYPDVYDYYRFDRVINMTKMDLPIKVWNDQLNANLKTLGKAKQVNIIIVITRDKPVEYFNGLIYYWAGGKKNDVIVGIDINEKQETNWVRSTSFADGMENMTLHATNESDLLDMKIGMGMMEQVVNNINKQFNRLPMEKMEYLKYRTLTKWESIIMFLVSFVPYIFIVLFEYIERRHNSRRY